MCLCCMNVWCVLVTVLVATAHGFVPTPHSIDPSGRCWNTGSATSTATKSRTSSSRYLMRATQRGSSLWWRQHRRDSHRTFVRAGPVEIGEPEVSPHDFNIAEGDATTTSEQGISPQHEPPTAGGVRSNRSGLLLLSTVPLVWGTYAPSVKYLYQMGDSTPGLVFNFACYVVSVLTFALVAAANSARRRGRGKKRASGSSR